MKIFVDNYIICFLECVAEELFHVRNRQSSKVTPNRWRQRINGATANCCYNLCCSHKWPKDSDSVGYRRGMSWERGEREVSQRSLMGGRCVKPENFNIQLQGCFCWHHLQLQACRPGLPSLLLMCVRWPTPLNDLSSWSANHAHVRDRGEKANIELQRGVPVNVRDSHRSGVSPRIEALHINTTRHGRHQIKTTEPMSWQRHLRFELLRSLLK